MTHVTGEEVVTRGMPDWHIDGQDDTRLWSGFALSFQTSTRRWPNVDLMLDRHRRRRANIDLTLGQRLRVCWVRPTSNVGPTLKQRLDKVRVIYDNKTDGIRRCGIQLPRCHHGWL